MIIVNALDMEKSRCCTLPIGGYVTKINDL